MNRRGLLAGAAGITVAGVAGALLLLFIIVAGVANPSGSAAYAAACTPGATGHVGSLPQLDSDQSKNAGIIIAVGASMHVPAQGLEVAIATAYQESTLRNLPYGDRDSLGLFQQRPSAGWGTPAQIMDPAYASRKFYTALLAVPGWQDMPITVAAQTVQQSAYPTAYAQWVPLAEHVVAAALKKGGAQIADGCQSSINPGHVVFPLPANSGYVDDNNYGAGGNLWAHGHTGDDFSVACGTPVFAVTDGRIIIEQGGYYTWAGKWLVKVSTGPHALTTWYAHMRSLNVQPGQVVKAGQQIGEVGDLGNATGCHLHLEVHPHNGTIYEDGVDPHVWLAQNLGQTTTP